MEGVVAGRGLGRDRAEVRGDERERLGSRQVAGDGHERDAELAGIRTIGRVGLADALEEATQRAQRARHVDRLADAGHEGADGGVGGEGDLAGDGLDQHEAERVHVGPPVDHLALGLLRRRVPGRAEHGALGLGPGRLGQRPGEAEVGDAQAAVVAEEQVGRLHVPVDEAAPVGVVEGPGGLEAEEQRLGRGAAQALVEQVPEAAAAQVLGDEVRGAPVVAPVVDGEDVRVVQGRRRLGLGPEPAEERLVVGEGLVQDLHRDAALQPNVIGEEDLGRRTGADRRDEPVPAAEHTTDLVCRTGHDHPARVSGAPVGLVPPPRPDWRRARPRPPARRRDAGRAEAVVEAVVIARRDELVPGFRVFLILVLSLKWLWASGVTRLKPGAALGLFMIEGVSIVAAFGAVDAPLGARARPRRHGRAEHRAGGVVAPRVPRGPPAVSRPEPARSEVP